MGGCIGDCDHSARLYTIDNCCAGTGANHFQAFADGEMLVIRRLGNDDGIAGGSQQDGMPNGLAGRRERLAVVAVPSAHSVDVPSGAGQSGWHSGKQ